MQSAASPTAVPGAAPTTTAQGLAALVGGRAPALFGTLTPTVGTDAEAGAGPISVGDAFAQALASTLGVSPSSAATSAAAPETTAAGAAPTVGPIQSPVFTLETLQAAAASGDVKSATTSAGATTIPVAETAATANTALAAEATATVESQSAAATAALESQLAEASASGGSTTPTATDPAAGAVPLSAARTASPGEAKPAPGAKHASKEDKSSAAAAAAIAATQTSLQTPVPLLSVAPVTTSTPATPASDSGTADAGDSLAISPTTAAAAARGGASPQRPAATDDAEADAADAASSDAEASAGSTSQTASATSADAALSAWLAQPFSTPAGTPTPIAGSSAAPAQTAAQAPGAASPGAASPATASPVNASQTLNLAPTTQLQAISITGASAAQLSGAQFTAGALQDPADQSDPALDADAADAAMDAPTAAAAAVSLSTGAKTAAAPKTDAKTAAASTGPSDLSAAAPDAAASPNLALKTAQSDAENGGASGQDRSSDKAASDAGAGASTTDAASGNATNVDNTAVPVTTAGAASNVAAATSDLAAGRGQAIVSQIASQITGKTTAGKSTSFDIALDPAGLGRVDVQVRIDSAGQVSASMSFSNQQSATAAQAHAGDLQHALEQAGFNVSQGGLSFDVGGQGAGFARQDAQPQNPGLASQSFIDASTDQIAASGAFTQTAGASGLDITI